MTAMMDKGNKARPLPSDDHSFERDDKSLEEVRRDQRAQRKEKLDDALDRGLEDSFPGSDPVSVTQPPPSARDKRNR
jgi:hypothetical protein